jgi:FMN phosphatase YigB (HAD superfamily)
VVTAVFFDVGSTIVDEARVWREWAARLGVPEASLVAELQEAIRLREHHRTLFERLDRVAEAKQAERDLGPVTFDRGDLYADVETCFARLRDEGYLIGIAGNQPPQANERLRSLGLPATILATSAEWGVEKPAAAFFERVADVARRPPREIAYVGDRIDNDVVPAARIGMVPVFLRRGLWAEIQAGWPESGEARIRIESLHELPAALRSLP